MSEITSESKLTTKEIVEQAIQDYHESILPYLNGQVPTIANKFDKANLYSTDEQIVGRWIDGKPIYQKVIEKTLSATSDWVTVDSSVSYEYIIGVKALHKSVGYIAYSTLTTEPRFTLVNNTLKYYTTSNVGDCCVIVTYTKTTDEAIAIGSDTDYSTTEKIVGTWIDGKPLYQKTVDCGALPNATSINKAHNISNIDKIINTYGIGINNVGISIIVGGCSTNTNHTGDIGLAVTRSNISLLTYMDRSNYNAYITLQYTKTTD